MTIIMSDIHGNSEALDAVLKDAQTVTRLNALDRLIILGDIIDYGADSLKVTQTLNDLRISTGVATICLKGNHEAAFISKRKTDEMIKTPHGRLSMGLTRKDMTDTRDFEDLMYTSGFSFQFSSRGKIFVHGTTSDPMRGIIPHKLCTDDKLLNEVVKQRLLSRNFIPRIVFGGHSHVQGWAKSEGAADFYINPGSVGQPRNGDPRAQYLLCDDDFTRFVFRRVEYDIDKCADKIIKSGRSPFLATRLYLGI